MQPGGRADEPCGCLLPHARRPAVADLGGGQRVDRRIEAGVLERDVGAQLRWPVAEQDGGRGIEQRSGADGGARGRRIAVDQARRSVPREDRQVHVGRLAGRRALAVVEVGVPVDEPQPAAARQGLEDAQHQRAVAADNERELARTAHVAHPRRDVGCRSAHVQRADHAGRGVAARVANLRVGRAAVARPEPLDQPGRTQRRWRKLLAPPRARAVERSIDDGEASEATQGAPTPIAARTSRNVSDAIARARSAPCWRADSSAASSGRSSA